MSDATSADVATLCRNRLALLRPLVRDLAESIRGAANSLAIAAAFDADFATNLTPRADTTPQVDVAMAGLTRDVERFRMLFAMVQEDRSTLRYIGAAETADTPPSP